MVNPLESEMTDKTGQPVSDIFTPNPTETLNRGSGESTKNIETIINPGPSEIKEFGDDTPDRAENIARLTEVAKAIADSQPARGEMALAAFKGEAILSPEATQEAFDNLFEGFRVSNQDHLLDQANDRYTALLVRPPKGLDKYIAMRKVISEFSDKTTSQHGEAA